MDLSGPLHRLPIISCESDSDTEDSTVDKSYTGSTTTDQEQIETLTLLELLDKDEHKDVDEFEEAHQDFVHMFTCQAVLRSSFPHANVLQHVTVNIDKAEDVPDDARERALYRYLTNLKPNTFDGHYSDIWREYGTLLMAENLLELARRANGPDQNSYVVVRKTQFYEIQSELQLKTQEVEELLTRLSKYENQQLSDTRRPTRLGEMYSQLLGDEWSEAFEAFKDSTMAKEGDDDDDEEMYTNILSILQTLVKETFRFCREKSCEQLQDLENKIKEVLKPYSEPQTQWPKKGENNYTKVNPMDEPFQKSLDRTTERFSKEIRVAASVETVKYQSQIFIKERLPNVLPVEQVRQDQRVISYVQKCMEICWFMNVQDPPMELVAPLDKNVFSQDGRKVSDNFFGMGKELENLFLKNAELLRTNKVHIPKEEIGNLQGANTKLNTRIKELEEELKKTKEEIEKSDTASKEEKEEDDVPMALRKRFSRTDMARVLMERNQCRERLKELEENVRWTELIRAAREHPEAKQKKGSISNWLSYWTHPKGEDGK